MRSELGKMSMDKIFREREALNISIVESINKAAEAWGIVCLRYEIRDIKVRTMFSSFPAQPFNFSVLDAVENTRSNANAGRS